MLGKYIQILLSFSDAPKTVNLVPLKLIADFAVNGKKYFYDEWTSAACLNLYSSVLASPALDTRFQEMIQLATLKGAGLGVVQGRVLDYISLYCIHMNFISLFSGVVSQLFC